MINYIEGDLFAAIKAKPANTPIIVPHICNNKGGWGAGFVVPLGKHYPAAKANYLRSKMRLGSVGFTQCNNVLICNMVAQELGGDRPLYYNHLARCMDKVAYKMGGYPYEIHAPAFGSGLAGGDWDIIKELIEDCWIRKCTPASINIYYLPGTFLPPDAPKELPADGPVDRPYSSNSKHHNLNFPG